jgi:hypothetical protein
MRVLLAVQSLLLFGVASACSLEWTVEPVALPDPIGVGGQTPPASADSSSPSNITPHPSSPDAAEPSDAGSDAVTANDAGDGGSDADAGDCFPARCDCDGDGFNDLTRAGCEDAGGPHDCDDRDNRAKPNQTFLEDTAVAPRFGDWNCKDGVEKMYPSNVACGLLSLTGCAGVQGFKQNPACGAEGAFIFCEVQAGLLCAEGSPSTRVQSCK